MAVVNRSQTTRILVRITVVGALTGILLTLLAPYNTIAIFSVWERLLFWMLTSFIGCGILMAVYVAAAHAARDYDVPAYAWLPLSVLIAALPSTLIVHATATAVSGDVQLQPFWSLFPSVLVLCVPLQIILHMMTAAEFAPTVPNAPDPQPIDRSPLLDKLPKHLGDEIICMKMEDHYLRVFTPLGDTLILMRIGDAVKTVGPSAGMQVHRSWWVGRNAIDHTKLTGTTLHLILKNGLKVPVSRERRHALEACHWFAW